MNQKIITIANELEAAGIKHEIADYIGSNLRIKTSDARNATNPYLLLSDLSGDIGAVILTVNEKTIYYFWESLGGSRSKDREFISTSEFIDEFDRFIIRWHLDTFMPNPYFDYQMRLNLYALLCSL
jgi:hypothetical protein